MRSQNEDTDKEYSSDEEPVRITVSQSGLKLDNDGTRFDPTVLGNLKATSLTETSGDPAKVLKLIELIKMGRNKSLTRLTIQNAILSDVDFSGVSLPALERLDLKDCVISVKALKGLLSEAPRLNEVDTSNFQITTNSHAEFNEFKNQFKLFESASAEYVKVENGSAMGVGSLDVPGSAVPKPSIVPATQSVFNSDIDDASDPDDDDETMSLDSLDNRYGSAVPQTQFVPATKPKRHVHFENTLIVNKSTTCMDAVRALYISQLPDHASSDSIKVIPDPRHDQATLMQGSDKLMQSNGREVKAFSTLTKADSGIDISLQAKMILKGLGVTAVEAEEVEATTELPALKDLEFGRNNENPELEYAIQSVLTDLLLERDAKKHRSTPFL